MILLVHLLFGAAIGSAVKNVPTAIILAFLSHYLLDLIPHTEYPLGGIKTKRENLVPDVVRVAIDFCLGILLILIFSKPALPAGRQAIIYICAFVAIIPDAFTLLNNLASNRILSLHNKFHHDIIHFLKNNKKISNFWRVVGQIAVVIISIALIRI